MHNRRLGIFIPPINDNCQGVMRGIVRFVQDHGGWSIDTETAIPSLPWESFDRWQGDGIIAMVLLAEHYDLIRATSIPVVNTCARINTTAVPSVFSDNRAIGSKAAEHLLGLALKQFVVIGRLTIHHDAERIAGFIDAIHLKGLPCRQIMVETDVPSPDDRADRRMVADALRDVDRPVGIFAAQDNLGALAINACRELDIAVPDEAAVIGVNNFELLCETAQPPLSSVCQQAEKTGYLAAELLNRMVEGREVDNEQIRLPPGRLVERRSTDFLAVDDPDVLGALKFIRANAANPITLGDVLRHVAVSRETLNRRFAKAIGHVPALEIRLSRLLRAQKLLASTQETVTSVALGSGFRSVSGFDRAFREHTGMTPREYRRRFAP